MLPVHHPLRPDFPQPPPRPSVRLSLPLDSLPTHLLLVLRLCLFEPPLCAFFPALFPSLIPSLEAVRRLGRAPFQMGHVKKCSATKSGGGGVGGGGAGRTLGEFKGRRRRGRKNAVMESRIAVKRGRNAEEAGRLALINDSVLIQRRHHLFL